MNIKLIGGVLAVCMVASVTLAQDPTVVEPTHYKLAFENDQVQVVDVHYGPHEKSKMHSHPGGVVVYITAGHLKFTDENGKVTEVNASPGSHATSRRSITKWRTLAISRLTRCTLG